MFDFLATTEYPGGGPSACTPYHFTMPEPPAAPVITASIPAGPSGSLWPTFFGTAEADSTVRLYVDNGTRAASNSLSANTAVAGTAGRVISTTSR